MMHRLECDPDDECECRCHERCGMALPQTGEPCYRRPGHTDYHRSRYAIDNKRRSLEVKRGPLPWMTPSQRTNAGS